MPADGPHMFTDREEEVALFEAFLGSNPDGSWPLLPILAFIAPGGSGKSTLIKHLIDEKCSVDGRPVIPYARLDFTPGRGAPTELLSILIRLRDELQRQPDRDGHHLSFPRFDLGALVAQAPSSIEDLAALVPDEIRKKLDNGTQLLASLGTLGTSLVTTLPVIGPLVAALKLAQQLPPRRKWLPGFPREAHGLDVVSAARHGHGAASRGDDEGGPRPPAGVEPARDAGA